MQVPIALISICLLNFVLLAVFYVICFVFSCLEGMIGVWYLLWNGRSTHETNFSAKLSALMGVSEALAPSIYMPVSSYIYIKTIETFPGAFYMFDAVLTVFALGLFG